MYHIHLYRHALSSLEQSQYVIRLPPPFLHSFTPKPLSRYGASIYLKIFIRYIGDAALVFYPRLAFVFMRSRVAMHGFWCVYFEHILCTFV